MSQVLWEAPTVQVRRQGSGRRNNLSKTRAENGGTRAQAHTRARPSPACVWSVLASLGNWSTLSVRYWACDSKTATSRACDQNTHSVLSHGVVMQLTFLALKAATAECASVKEQNYVFENLHYSLVSCDLTCTEIEWRLRKTSPWWEMKSLIL